MPHRDPRSVLNALLPLLYIPLVFGLYDYSPFVVMVVLFLVLSIGLVCMLHDLQKGATPHTVAPTAPPVADEGEQEPDLLVQNPTPGAKTVRRTLTLIVEAGNPEALEFACDTVLAAIRIQEVHLTAHLL